MLIFTFNSIRFSNQKTNKTLVKYVITIRVKYNLIVLFECSGVFSKSLFKSSLRPSTKFG